MAIRSNTFRLIVDRQAAATLRLLGDRASRLWNSANYLCRQRFLAGESVPGYAGLCRLLVADENYRALPSDMAQEVLKKLRESWKSYFELVKLHKKGKLQHKPGLPQYRKNRKNGIRPFDLLPIKCDRSYTVESWRITITLPADLRSAQKRLSLKYRGLRRYTGDNGRAEISYDRSRDRWYFRHAVTVPDKAVPPRQKAAAIDLGIRIAAAVSIEGNSQATLYSSRELLKDWDYWNRRIAGHMKELAHRPRGERSSRQLRQYYHKRRSHWEHAWRGIARAIAATLSANQVAEVFIGWPKNIRRDKDYSATWNGRLHNFWGFDQASRVLAAALERKGITVHRVKESHTSSTCPFCGSKNVVREPRHLLYCKDCDLMIHSDQAGSRNILKQNKPSTTWDGVEATPRPDVRRWTRHLWTDAVNRIESMRLAA